MEVMAAEAERGIDMSRMASEIAKTRNKHLAKCGRASRALLFPCRCRERVCVWGGRVFRCLC